MNNMHPMLREFERESGLEIYGLGAKRVPWEAAMEKYAELIVKECAWLVDENDISLPYGTFGKLIKQHFGIEE